MELLPRSRAKVVLILGKRFSGKDTFASLLAQALEMRGARVALLSTSLGLKKKFCQINHLDFKQFLSDRDYKERYRDELTTYVSKHDPKDNYEVFSKTLTEVLITHDIVIISDIRSVYDFTHIMVDFATPLTLRVLTEDSVRAQRGYTPTSYDTSDFETALDAIECDFVVSNNGALTDLDSSATQISSVLSY